MRESSNVEEQSGGGGSFGGGGIRLGGGALVLIVIVSVLFGINPLTLIGGLESVSPPSGQTAPAQPPPGYGPQTERVPPARPPIRQPAETRGPRAGRHRGRVGCRVPDERGRRTRRRPSCSSTAPCARRAASRTPPSVRSTVPGDRKLYLDTAFFDELTRRFKAPGDFAQAYVIAHEVGHHVQNLTGVMQQVDARRSRLDERGNNALSIRLELQADCYAGVWGYFAQKRGKLDPGDIEEGLAAASAVGDDQIQKRTQGYVVPESFTHGTAAQRSYWFKTGLASGDMRKCDTFATRDP